MTYLAILNDKKAVIISRSTYYRIRDDKDSWFIGKWENKKIAFSKEQVLLIRRFKDEI